VVPYEIMAENIMCMSVSWICSPRGCTTSYPSVVLFPIDYIYLFSPNRKWSLKILLLYSHSLFATSVGVTLLTVKLDGKIGQLRVTTILFLEKELVALLR